MQFIYYLITVYFKIYTLEEMVNVSPYRIEHLYSTFAEIFIVFALLFSAYARKNVFCSLFSTSLKFKYNYFEIMRFFFVNSAGMELGRCKQTMLLSIYVMNRKNCIGFE